MRSTRSIAMAAALALQFLAACSDDSGDRLGGGGVETGDLTVLVADDGGNLLVGARVWLLDDQGDSTESVALDSASTSGTGSASFWLTRPSAGVEAWSGDTLAGLDRGDERLPGDTVSMHLLPPVPLRLSCQEFGQMAIHQPGSRRRQMAPSPCADSFTVEVIVPANILRAIPLTGPKRPVIIMLDGGRFGSSRKGAGRSVPST